MQEEGKSEDCISTKARQRKEGEMKTRRCLLSQPRTKIGLLICALGEAGADGKERNKDPDFVLASAEKNGKLIKCSYIKKKYCKSGGNSKHRTAPRTLTFPRAQRPDTNPSTQIPTTCPRPGGPGTPFTPSTPMATRGAPVP